MLLSEFKTNLRDSYDNRAAERESMQLQDWKEKERNLFMSKLEKEKAKTLLEIGAGTGKDSVFFKESGLDTTSTDLSPEMVKICTSKGLKAYEMSFDQLDFNDHSYDAVWALNCLLHVPKADLVDTLKEIKRVLKPNGIFFIGVYGGSNFEGIWEDDFYEPKRYFSFYTNEEMNTILSEHFSIESFKVVPKEVVGGEYHFQSFILKNLVEVYGK